MLEETTHSLEREPAPEKFVGDVIITPDCLASVLGSVVAALSGPQLYAGTERVQGQNRRDDRESPLFSLSNKPRAEEFPEGADFDGFGVPTDDLEVIGGGVLKNFMVGFFYSKKLKTAQTAGVQNLSVAAGDADFAEMIANTKRGILFSRFSGGMPNDNLDFSGIAKNSFYIEDGKLRHALDETMVSGNFQELLRNIHAVSRERINFGDSSYPFVAASGVTISSK